MNDRPIILVGGGTGGHIFPLIAVAEELQSAKINFIYVGSKGSLEESVVKSLNWPFLSIEAGKWRRYINVSSIFQNIIDVYKMIKGFFQAIKLLRKTRAKLVVSKGGYVAVPMLYAARIVGCPVIVHESDSIMGVANRIGSKFAKRVLTAFDPEIFVGHDQRYVKVGIPIRRSLRQAAKLKSPRKVRPLVLVIPGSQGSVAINQYIKERLAELLNICDIVHLTGQKDYSQFEALKKDLPKNLSERYRPYKFIDRELPYYFQSADLVVGRASATTVAEAALFAKPIYIVPLPDSANNHQQKNASLLEQAKSAYVKQQYQLSADKFYQDIKKLLSNSQSLEETGKNLANYFNSLNATQMFIEQINNASQN